ncbi:MAG TPA: DMT family transporter [Mycobacteriales bacterium]|nr:DMT family transporter [Mycobacteriales bacterium]
MTYVLAVLAAVAYGANWVLQQHEAAEAPTKLQLHPVRLIEHLLHRPLWLVGLLALIVGSVVQEVALAYGSLPVVEAVLVLALVFALVLNSRLSQQPVSPPRWLGAALVCAGLATFLLAGDPTPGRGSGADSHWFFVLIVLGGLAALLCVVAWRLPGSGRAAMCSTAAALMFGLSDALSKAVFNRDGSQVHLLIFWQLYGALGSAILAVALSQIAYNAAPLAVSLPFLAVGEPLAGLFAGVVALKVHFATTISALAWEAVAAFAVVVGSMAMGWGRGLHLHRPGPA